MPKKDVKILQFPGPSKQGQDAKPPEAPKSSKSSKPLVGSGQASHESWRLQASAVFWHLVAFLFPSFSVWQGLYLRWEIWYSVIVLLLFMAFFLFFLPQNRLELLTKEVRKVPFWRKLWDARHVRGPALKLPPASSSIFGVSSSFANDGKGTWSGVQADDEDGSTIEEYLQQRKQGGAGNARQGFDWNWHAQGQGDEADSLGLFVGSGYKRKPFSFSEFCAKVCKALLEFWQQNWTLVWRSYSESPSAGVSVPMFWLTSLAWGPLLYWGATGSVGLQQRLGLSSWGSLAFVLLFCCLLFPLLEQQQKGKLFCALGEQRSVYTKWLARVGHSDAFVRLPLFLNLAIEFGSSVALGLLLWPLVSSATFFWVVALLLFVSTWFRLNLPRLNQPRVARGVRVGGLPLYLYRLLSCLSASVALLLAAQV